MSVPQIPGYTSSSSGGSLDTLWEKPAGSYPSDLWPSDKLNSINPHPDGWLVVAERFYRDERDGGTGCILVPTENVDGALEKTSWTGRDLGRFGSWGSGNLNTGLFEKEGNHAEFFLQVRDAVGRDTPHLEISHPFLWYWDAYEVSSGWRYVNSAGREQELIRHTLTPDTWKVEIRALEFRSYLATCQRSAIIQVDLTIKLKEGSFERVDDAYKCSWAHFDFYALDDLHITESPVFSKLMGQYVIGGQRTSRVPRWEQSEEDPEYPSFIYGVEATSGKPLIHSCDPSSLGTYFDKDGSRLHHLTPIYFNRAVLLPYASEPSRYSVSRSRLSCLGLWGIDISFNSIGLVEAYLGDLGGRLPPEEWGRWSAYNVPPEGKMDEGRFRRDFLNQPASSVDPIGDLRRALQAANSVASELYGSSLWRTLPLDLEREYQSLIGPLSDDPAALATPVLVLTKTLVDSLDIKLLRKIAPGVDARDQSLRLLQKVLDSLGDEEDLSRILRDLQSLRSRGGIAHLPNSDSPTAKSFMKIGELGAARAFDTTLVQLTSMFSCIAGLLEAEKFGGSFT